ncbi:protocatechuate 3,4-dioxygenase subunit alpha [Spelaeicoccus albus]|uniref:Protocatechuate 3,4-dioxygenase alpha subunit n=1 Tax=Spelaeicoccus albus TaxID=1280376 RepID=A0A7Z0AAV4_9MICO|nr:protocatechuate 3,4-dioxygenase subunit alpha [Spelaeicoccus albus]NYI66750.1 protocatechuate 3,4-dioxygenase alpha subunit [Spelaeicoccus albus]
MTSQPTPGQTVGPFFHYSLPYDDGPELVGPYDARAVTLHGYLYDGHGDPVPDGLIEIWQVGEAGTVVQETGSLRRDHRTFTGFGRAQTDADGHFRFFTVIPGIDPKRPDVAPFIAVVVLARGLLDKLHTRIYLPGYADLNAADPLLTSLDPAERDTLTATEDGEGSLRHDLRLQGENETVFLAFG